MELNTIGIAGTVAAAPEKHRNVYGQENIYAMWLDTARDSGIADRILVLFQGNKINGESLGAYPPDAFTPEDLVELIKEGSRIEVTGQIQTYKNRDTGRTQLFVWAAYVAALPEGSQQLNNVYLNAEVFRVPTYRETPKGRYITDLALVVPSAFAEGYTCIIPGIAWGRTAAWAAYLEPGVPVYLEGRLQSRDYMKEGQVFTTWEVSVSKITTKE
ncbi:MAG: single-stranded DNA-binding protein [Clostridia bacterium]|nr:single-stranded DNA-binding protein [Clostridia bacterium]